MLQNDLVALMNVIEKNMQIYFKNESEKPQVSIPEKKVDVEEPIMISITEEKKDFNEEKSSELKLPFAKIDLVSPNSPAEEAGLREGDKIVSFENVTHSEKDPLKRIADIVGKKLNNIIKVEVLRKEIINESEERLVYVSLELTPHTWNGQGVLG